MPCTVHRRMNVKLSIVDKMACNLKTDGHSYSCNEFPGIPSGESLAKGFLECSYQQSKCHNGTDFNTSLLVNHIVSI